MTRRGFVKLPRDTNYAPLSPLLGEGQRGIARGATASHLRDLSPFDNRMAVFTAFWTPRLLGGEDGF